MVSTVSNVVFYADDPNALATFWAAVLGYPAPDPEGFAAFAAEHGVSAEMVATRSVAEDPTGAGPRLFFHHASEPKQARNRIHLDVRSVADRRPTPQDIEAEKQRLVALGATPVRLVEQSWGDFAEHYWQMLDPEGNEFCLQ
jgi:catechol 2,3-dioxygenase-like lactoylglutathione lyase family enzyme